LTSDKGAEQRAAAVGAEPRKEDEFIGHWTCLFCAGTCEMWESESGPAVAHTLPMCRVFEDLNVEDFVSVSLAFRNAQIPSTEG
jgi:hypothetical protein